MQEFLILNMVKSQEFNLMLKKTTTRLKFKVVENYEAHKDINLAFVDVSSINLLQNTLKDTALIGVTFDPGDIDTFYRNSIFYLIPEKVTEVQLDSLFNQQVVLHGFDLLKLAFKKNKSFAFTDLFYYIDTVFMNSTLGVAFITTNLDTLVYNPNFSTFFHNIYNENPVIGKAIHTNLDKKSASFWNTIIEKCSSFIGECTDLQGKWDDVRKHYQIQVTPILKLTKIIGYAIIIKDISQFTNANADLKRYYKYLLEQNERLEKAYKELELNNDKLKIAYEKVNALSNHDYLTQAPNRKYFLEKIEYEQLRFKRTKNPFILVYGDIDDFKNVNDLYGHETGDYILISLSNLIKDTIRNIDFFCRWGGEEFLIFLAEADLVIGKNIVNRILQEIRNYEFNYNGSTIKITMTFGLALYNEDQHINQIIDIADKKLYWGKKHNKDQAVDVIPD